MVLRELSGKVAIITGAGRPKGMGRAIALQLAQMGADIVIADLPVPMRGYEWYPTGDRKGLEAVAGEVRKLNGHVLAVDVDVTDPTLVQAMVDKTVETFGQIDILVNNAGASPGVGPITDISLEAWQKTIDINLTGTFLCSQAVLQIMVAAGNGGRIINISSIAAKQPGPYIAPYNASKAGVIALTQTIAVEMGKLGITANAICPGNIDTDLLDTELDFMAEAEGLTLDQVRQAYIDEVPVKRLGQAKDVAKVVGFLASSAADYLTGQTINVDGGLLFY